MKKCTWCGKEYADEATVCEVDAQPLTPLHLPPVPSAALSVPPILSRWPGRKLLIGTALLVLVNMLIAFTRFRGDLAFNLGAATSQLIIPLLGVLVFSVSSRFRNPRAWTKIVLWVSVVLLLAKAGAQLAEDGRGHYHRGVNAYEQQKYKRAAAEFTKCLRYDLKGPPSKSDVLGLRACAWGRMGKFEAAISDVREALKLDPQHAAASELLAALLANELDERSRRIESISTFIEPGVLRKTNKLTPQDVPALTNAITVGVTFIRLKAVKALGELGPSATTALPTLRQTEQNDPDPRVRAVAKAAILKISESNSVPGR